MALQTRLSLLRPSTLRRWLIELPVDRAIALARILLALTCIAGVAIHPPPGEQPLFIATIILVAYFVYSVILALIWIQPGAWFYYAQHCIDIATTSALIYLTEGSASAFFTLFVFSLVTGVLRWNWRGALTTSIILAIVLLLLPSEFQVTPTGLQIVDADLSRAVVRAGFLVVCGAMLAYLGAHRERSRRRFAQLAAWPAGPVQDDTESLDPFARSCRNGHAGASGVTHLGGT